MPESTTAAVARFQIDGKTYSTATLDEITLKDLLLFEVQARDLGLDVTWAQLQERAAALDTADEAAADRDGLLMMAATIWASRRMAGEDVTFGDAIDVPLASIVFLPPTEDHKPGPPKARKKGRPKASAPHTAGDAAAASDGTTSATSG